MPNPILSEQIAYYRARAGEYDQWFLRQGRYDRGDEHRAKWFGEVAKLEAALSEAQPHGDILELACGTGLWSQHLIRNAHTLTAIDASPEVLEINRQRLSSPIARFLQADLFDWQPNQQYNFIFFSFWLSHVPEDRLEKFWQTLRTALKPDGKVFFIDSLFTSDSTAKDHKMIDHSGVVERKLNDGQTFRIVKMFHEPKSLEERLRRMGWNGIVRSTGEFFYYGLFSEE